jgi:hypothetical protein
MRGIIVIKTSDYEIFERNVSTLKETSKDNHDGTVYYMTDSLLPTINFDQVKDEYIRSLQLCENPKSIDALFITTKGQPIFIEFKNGFMDKRKCFDVKRKVYDSILIFADITKRSINYTRKNMDYILVYNEEKNCECDIDNPSTVVQESTAKYLIGKRLMALGGSNYIRFGLERFKTYLFRNVYTYTQNEFAKYCINAIHE